MEKNYREAIKTKYEKEKLGVHSSFLLNPTPARLRELCEMVFKDNKDTNDLYFFNVFFGFEFNQDNIGKLRNHVDRFKPIGSFLKGKTEPADINTVNIAAILVDFNPRPFQKYLKENETAKSAKEEQSVHFTENINNDFISPEPQTSHPSVAGTITLTENKATPTALTLLKNKTVSIKQIGKVAMSLLVIVVSTFGLKAYISPKKECMQWQKNHYELVDCSVSGIASINEIIPAKKEELKLKKIEVTTNTPFFQKDKAIVWYCKKNGVLEYFNTAGFHPETGKPLKPITQYMIDKYIKKQLNTQDNSSKSQLSDKKK